MYHIPIATLSTRMTSALRWAAMRAILMFHNCEGQGHKTESTDHNFMYDVLRVLVIDPHSPLPHPPPPPPGKLFG